MGIFFLSTDMSKLEDYCRNPECSARFSKTTKAESRPLPADLVDAAAITAYYKGHPDEAAHRSPDRVCLACCHPKNVKTPRWRPEHMYAHVVSLVFFLLITPLVSPFFPFHSRLFFIDCVNLVGPPSSVPAAALTTRVQPEALVRSLFTYSFHQFLPCALLTLLRHVFCVQPATATAIPQSAATS